MRIVQLGIILGGNFPGGNCLGGHYPGQEIGLVLSIFENCLVKLFIRILLKLVQIALSEILIVSDPHICLLYANLRRLKNIFNLIYLIFK